MPHPILTFWWLITSATNAFYGIVSGWLGDVTLFTGLIMYFIHSRCHIPGCYRHGKHPFKHYKLCRLHHPDVPAKLTHLHIAQLHKSDIIKQ